QTGIHGDARGGLGIQWVSVDEIRYSAGKRMDRITDSEIAPAMATRASEGDFETAAAESLGGDVIERCAVEYEEGCDLRNKGGLAADMADASQVAFAFFAYIRDEKDAAPDIFGSVGSARFGSL